MRALIVGCGYVGFQLAEKLLQRGHEVFGLRRSNAEQLQAAGIKPLLADITQFDSLKNLPRDFDWIVNCVAAKTSGNYRATYFDGAKNLLAWLEIFRPQKFVHVSSTSVYAQSDGSIVTEKSPAQPEIETSKILVEAEKLLLDAFMQKKFPAIILRAAGIYGPQRGHILQKFLDGTARLDGDGSRFLNMIHRDDLAGGVFAALQNGRAGEIYNAVDDGPVSQKNFFQWFAGELGKSLPQAAPENFAPRKRGATNKQVSNQKLKNELGYQFEFPTFREGYREIISAAASASAPRLDRTNR